MANGDYYLVDFGEAIQAFQRAVASPDAIEQYHLPTLDIEQITWLVMEMFYQPNPLVFLERFVVDAVSHDWLYSKTDFVWTTPANAKRQEQAMRAYLSAQLLQFGVQLYDRLRTVGLVATGQERYKVILRPLDHDTYTLRRCR